MMKTYRRPTFSCTNEEGMLEKFHLFLYLRILTRTYESY